MPSPFRTSPFRPSPFRTSPFRPSPFRTSPFRTSPFRTAPFRTAPSGHCDGVDGRKANDDSGILPAAEVHAFGADLDDQTRDGLALHIDHESLFLFLAGFQQFV